MKKQSGFTLIELVVVMVILGILAAVALPKFVDMSSDARKASLKGALGAVNSAMAITHASSLVASKAADPISTVTAEGSTINMAYGYPALAGIATAAGISASDYTIDPAGPTTIQVKGAKTPANCQISYAEATLGVAPVVVVTDSGC